MTKFIVPAVILVLVLVAAAAVFTQAYMDYDPPTTASTDEKLKVVGLPTNLPPIASDSGGAGGSTSDYKRAIGIYVDKADFLKTNPPPKELIEDLTQAIVGAAKSGPPEHGWADSHVPFKPGGQPDWYSAPMEIADIIIENEIMTSVSGGKFTGSKARARRVIDAIFLFGKRMYETSDRVLIRRDGMKVMDKALAMREMALGDRKDATAWRDAIFKVQQTWEQKLKAIYALDASVSDLVRFATLDKDPAFQIEAILQLGIAQWTKKSIGNQRIIDNALADLARSKNASIAAAAKAAQSMNERGDVHKAV